MASYVGTFICSECNLTEKYNYYGRNPPFTKGINFIEDCYVAKDPFVPKEQRLFLLLGSHCAVCNKPVCQSQNCSIYYSKRFCMSCAKTHVFKFPDEIQKEIFKVKNG